MKILITGGFGYLGMNLSRLLKNIGYNIRIFDLSKPNNHNNSIEDYEVYLGDMLNKNEIKKACAGVDFVVHLAGIDQQKCKEDSLLALKINGFGTRNVLEAAKEAGVKRFIYMSTFHIYGKSEGNISEETIPTPLTDYGITKLIGEYYCRQFNNGMKCIIIRLSNGYGTPLTEAGRNFVINDFCRQSIEKQKIILRTKGKQKRNFIAISDISQAINILLRSEFKENTFNVGGDNQLSIYELAELIAQTYLEVYGKEVKIEFDKNLIEEQSTGFVYDTSRIRKLGFEPKAEIKEEIKEILKIFEGENID